MKKRGGWKGLGKNRTIKELISGKNDVSISEAIISSKWD